MKKFIVIILSGALLMACSKESNNLTIANEEIASQPGGNSQITKLFKGAFQSSVNPDLSIPPTPCSGDIPGFAIPERYLLNGHATHLGELQGQQSGFQHVSCNLTVSSFQLTAIISGQLSASNGDLIYYTGNDVIDVSNLLTQQGTTGAIEGVWTITGGTGRFAGASGSFTINGAVNFATMTLGFTAEGTITY